jgi:hypothetical protein
MAKKKPKKPKAGKVIKSAKVSRIGDYTEDKCENDEQAEAALVYAVRSFNKYFKQGVIVAKVKNDKFKVVTFGPGSPQEHFKPVMWESIKAAYEAFKEGVNEDQIFDG